MSKNKNYKVNVIAHQLKNKVIAKFGAVVNSSQLTSSSEELLAKGFIIELSKKEHEAIKKAEKIALDAAKEVKTLKTNPNGAGADGGADAGSDNNITESTAALALKRKNAILLLNTKDEVNTALVGETAQSVKKAGLLRITQLDALDVEKRKEAIADSKTVEEVTALLSGEENQTIVDAGNAKILELNTAAGVNAGSGTA